MHRPIQALRRAAIFPLALLMPGLLSAQTVAPDAAHLSTQQPLLSAMLLMMAITTGLLACLHARERYVLYLSGLMLCWVLLQSLGALQALGVPSRLLEFASTLLLPLFALCLVQFLLRQVAWTHPRLDQFLLLQCLMMPASLYFIGNAGRLLALSLWMAVLGLEMLLAMGWHLRLRWQALHAKSDHAAVQRRDFLVMVLLLGVAALALLAEPLAWQFHPGQASSLLAVTMPVLMLCLGLHITVVFGRARVDAESRQDQIEQRMHEKVADAERHFNTQAELKLEQVTERERKRIAADLHDDLGAKLLTIVHTSESDRISTLAREALEEMRLSVRGLTGKPVQLLDALGDWRAEVVSRLGQANILAEWKSPPEDIIHTLPARAYVQTTRIFRESVSNIIKHSSATHCTISCHVQNGDFLVVIQDNGHGIPAELDGRLDRGHGMASMKSRAKQMHGQCLVESGPGWGTVIRLTIPL
jgi:signal transduction histidine kinase